MWIYVQRAAFNYVANVSDMERGSLIKQGVDILTGTIAKPRIKIKWLTVGRVDTKQHE